MEIKIMKMDDGYRSDREMVDIQETCDVMDAQGGDRGRIGLGHTLYPVLWVGRRDTN